MEGADYQTSLVLAIVLLVGIDLSTSTSCEAGMEFPMLKVFCLLSTLPNWVLPWAAKRRFLPLFISVP